MRIRRHEDQKNKRARRCVSNSVLHIRWRQHDLARCQLTLIIADLKQPCPLNDEVDFIGAAMRVTFLFLTRLETVDVGKHLFGL